MDAYSRERLRTWNKAHALHGELIVRTKPVGIEPQELRAYIKLRPVKSECTHEVQRWTTAGWKRYMSVTIEEISCRGFNHLASRKDWEHLMVEDLRNMINDALRLLDF